MQTVSSQERLELAEGYSEEVLLVQVLQAQDPPAQVLARCLEMLRVALTWCLPA
jgi:hypothetical protein